MTLRGAQVLVTGGTGFIGGRLIEKLVLEQGARVRALVSDLAHASRMARFPIEIVSGNVTNSESVLKAMKDCDVVFHCAYGNTGTSDEMRAVTVGGTDAIAKAALSSKISRMVYVSSLAVYGPRTPDGDLDEGFPRKRSNQIYGDTKLEAEQLVLEYHRKYGLLATVIQPTLVYGPFGRDWTVGPLKQLERRRVVLVDGGTGLCNAVYVDDVVDAMILSACKEEAVGEAFLISAEKPITWREFYGAYERILGIDSTVSMSADEIKRLIDNQRRVKGTVGQVRQVLLERPGFRTRLFQLPVVAVPYRLVRAITPDSTWQFMKRKVLGAEEGEAAAKESGKALEIPDEARISFLGSKTFVKIDKAKQRLGYQPKFDFECGMVPTAQWIKWANLV